MSRCQTMECSECGIRYSNTYVFTYYNNDKWVCSFCKPKVEYAELKLAMAKRVLELFVWLPGIKRLFRGKKTKDVNMEDRQLLIDAVNGMSVSMGKCVEFEKLGIMDFTGNQNNPEWTFKASYIGGLSLEQLEELYSECRRLNK